MKRMYFTIIAVLVLSVCANAEISRNNYVDWIAASSKTSSSSHFIQWQSTLQNPGDCASPNGSIRTRLSVEDKELFSLLLAARIANKKVGFYYSTTATSGPVPGHGTQCQITNAWFESE